MTNYTFRMMAISALALGGVVSASAQTKPVASDLKVAAKEDVSASPDRLTQEVHHQLVMQSRYGVFDNLAYRVDGTTVTLFGQVTQPVLKSDAEKSVKGIEGVTRVVDNIEVLPVSPMDDQIRRAEYRAIYGSTELDRYAFQAIPSIHIIVKNGHVTLEGAVATASDRDIAGVKANSVPNVFSVENHLRVAP
jgi:osmotically-inducible protein OsmY